MTGSQNTSRPHIRITDKEEIDRLREISGKLRELSCAVKELAYPATADYLEFENSVHESLRDLHSLNAIIYSNKVN